MTTRSAVREFLAQKKLAIAGVSRSGKGFGNVVLKELRSKGYEMLPVHPEATETQDLTCVRSVADAAGAVGGLVLVTPPDATEHLVREAAAASIPRIWMQQGAESPAAVALCKESGIDVVHGECILMFAVPVRHVHRFHRWIQGLLGKLPD